MAVVLCMIFATMLASVMYFLEVNSKEAEESIYKLQAKYLAEAGNARALARLNVKTLPDLSPQQREELREGEDDDWEDWDDEDWEDWEEEDDDDWDDDWDDEYDEDEMMSWYNELNITAVKRYINFYQVHPYYININDGDIITVGGYHSKIAQQRQALEQAIALGMDVSEVLLIEEIYFPLPEVNVQRIGKIPIPRGLHLAPGFKLTFADQVPVDLWQNDIRTEYLNVYPSADEDLDKPVLERLTPNFGEPGQTIDIAVDGENLEEFKPVFNSLDLQVLSYSHNFITLQILDEAKPGKYKMRMGPQSAFFYVVPLYGGELNPIISDVIMPPEEGQQAGLQLTRMQPSQTIKGLRIEGSALGATDNVPIIVPSSDAFDITLVSFSDTSITLDLRARGARPGLHSFSIFTKGGQSETWTFAVEEKAENNKLDPSKGTYSTVATLLHVKSHSNIPLDTVSSGEIQDVQYEEGRPEEAFDEDDGRPEDFRDDEENEVSIREPRFQRSFDLLKSDMETVWKLETVATVMGYSYKETQIVRRERPNVHATITTNSRVSFGSSDIRINGMQEAVATLNEPSGPGDTEIVVEDERLNRDDPFSGIGSIVGGLNNTLAMPTGAAIVEELWFNLGMNTSPQGRGFKKGHVVAIIPPDGKTTFNDYAIVKETTDTEIIVHPPGFEDPHFQNDEIRQFRPSIITPFPISATNAQRYLSPPSSHISAPGKTGVEYVFGTSLQSMVDWGEGIKTDASVPEGIYEDFQGFVGMNIIQAKPNFDGANALAGQGLLVVDTTLGGLNPSGGTVRIGGGTTVPGQFDGVIYIIGDLQISGNVEITGGIIVDSPNRTSDLPISGHGYITYDPNSITKSLVGIPWTRAKAGRIMERSEGEEKFIEANKKSLRYKADPEER